MFDDYHNIHVKKIPQQLKTSTAIYMVSSILDIHVGIPACNAACKYPFSSPEPTISLVSTKIEGSGRHRFSSPKIRTSGPLRMLEV